ncbi:hypothetical protein Q7P35_008115 [Cladosporium inversicolor]
MFKTVTALSSGLNTACVPAAYEAELYGSCAPASPAIYIAGDALWSLLLYQRHKTDDDAYETQTADRGGSFDGYPKGGPLDASPGAGLITVNPQYREKLKEDELRLMKVLLGSEDELVRCETQIVPMSSSKEYFAVSYAWGPPIAEHAIKLDGREHMLPTNLWHFLKTWRSRMMPSSHETLQQTFERWETCTYWLWVDALCIDQPNAQERMHQVGIMSRIFGGAEEVLVWLGLAVAAADGLADWLHWKSWDQQITLLCVSHTISWKEFEKALFRAVDISNAKSMNSQRSRKELAQLGSKLVKVSAAQRMMHLCSGETKYTAFSVSQRPAPQGSTDYAMPVPQLMNLVLANLHSDDPPRTVQQIAIQCERLESLMGLEPECPWSTYDYFAAADPDFVASVQGNT